MGKFKDMLIEEQEDALIKAEQEEDSTYSTERTDWEWHEGAVPEDETPGDIMRRLMISF